MAAAPRAHVIVNRRAGRLRPGSKDGDLYAELVRSRPGIAVHETRSLEELDAAARRIATTSPGAVVVLAGGDGSYMAGVSALARAWGDAPLPPVALAPGGTVGTVARNWGMRGDPLRHAARQLDAIASGTLRTTLRPTLRVRDARGGDRVGFIFGAGLVSRFFEEYEARGASGNLAAAAIALRVFAGSFVGSAFARSVLAPVPCELSVDGRPAPFDRISLLCASVVADLGLRLRLTYRAGTELGRFHLVATPLGPRALGPQMPLVLAGRPLLGPRVDALTAAVELRFARGEGAYILDGDLFRADAITLTPGPELRVLG